MSLLGGALGNVAGALGTGSIGRASVALALDDSRYRTQLAEDEAATKAATGGMQSSTSAASAGMVTAYAAAGLAAGEFLKSSVEAAIEQKEASDKLANSIANSAKVSFDSIDAFNEQANALRDLTGVSDEAVTSGQSLLVQMGLTADQITQLTPLVVDLSAKNGIDLNAAFKAVGKAAEGSTGALARYVGPIEKGASASETYSNVLQKLGAVQGFAAAKADAEPWIKLEASFNELQETVGKGLLPVLAQAGSVLADLAQVKAPNAADAIGILTKAMQLQAAAGGVFSGTMNQGATDVDGLNAALASLNEQVQAGTITSAAATEQARQLAEAHHLTEDQVNQVAAGVERVTGAEERSSTETAKLAVEQKKAADAAREQKQANRELAAQLDVTASVFADFADRGHVSSEALLKDFDKQLRELRDYGDNMADLERRDLPQGLLDQLKEMGLSGAGIVDALAESNKADFNDIIQDWRRSQREAQTTAAGINGALAPLEKGYTIPIRFHLASAVEDIGAQVSQTVGNIAQQIEDQIARRGLT